MTELKPDETQADAKSASSKLSKLWLGLLPLLGLCMLVVCFTGGGLLVWRSFAEPAAEDEAVAVSEPPSQLNETSQPAFATAAPLPPTVTPAVTPTAAGALTNLSEQIIAPVPKACQTTNPVGRSSVSEPLISSISFATKQDAEGWPLDVAVQFTPPITRIQASFGYAGLRNGLSWERAWYFGDQALSRGQGTWDAGPEGQLTVHVEAGNGGFVPGRYRLEIYGAGQLLSQGSFIIAPEDSSTRGPIRMAYTTWDGQQHQINLFDLSTKKTQPLVEAARSPAWSPDADKLLFYSTTGLKGGTPGLWVLDPGREDNFQVIDEPFSQAIGWSSNGVHAATWVEKEAGPHLVLWNLATGQAYDGPVGATPAWSPEGRRLVFRSCTKAGWNLSTVQIIGNTFVGDSLQQLTGGDDYQPSWSPDGQQIAFVRREGDQSDIYLVNADGSGLKRLTNEAAHDVSPAWTPDKRLLFRSLRDGAWGIYEMNADGANQRRLLKTDSPVDWQPDNLAVSSDVTVVEPTATPVPKPKVQIPAGQGVLVVSNLKNNDEMTFTINNFEHKIPPHQYRTLPLPPGHYTWTASWPGKISRTGIADIALGQAAYPVVER